MLRHVQVDKAKKSLRAQVEQTGARVSQSVAARDRTEGDGGNVKDAPSKGCARQYSSSELSEAAQAAIGVSAYSGRGMTSEGRGGGEMGQNALAQEQELGEEVEWRRSGSEAEAECAAVAQVAAAPVIVEF